MNHFLIEGYRTTNEKFYNLVSYIPMILQDAKSARKSVPRCEA